MRFNAKVDLNQTEIVQALRQAGATVQSLAAVGKGVPDLLVCFRNKLYLMELKILKKNLNPLQEKWHKLWGGKVHVVRSIDEALKVIGIVV